MNSIETYKLARSGWVEKNGLWTYTEVIGGNKFRIGWDSITHKFYIGYGELPVTVETESHLLLVLSACGLDKQVVKYLAL